MNLELSKKLVFAPARMGERMAARRSTDSTCEFWIVDRAGDNHCSDTGRGEGEGTLARVFAFEIVPEHAEHHF